MEGTEAKERKSDATRRDDTQGGKKREIPNKTTVGKQRSTEKRKTGD